MNTHLRIAVITIALILSAYTCYAGKEASTGNKGEAPKITYGAWLDVTENSAYVMFKLNRECLAWVEIAPNDGTAFEAEARPRYYMTVAGRRLSAEFHKVLIKGLNAGTKYRYRIFATPLLSDQNPKELIYGGSKAVMKEKSFKTLDSNARTCSFTVINDIHGDDKRMEALCREINPKNTDFLVINGDQISKIEVIDDFLKHTFPPIKETARKVPVKYVKGNHESRGREWYKLGEVFPNKNTGEFYYSFRQGPVAFIAIDGGEDKPDNHPEYSGTADFDSYRAEELAWLKAELEKPEFASAPVKICLCHIPPFKNKKAWYCCRWLANEVTPLLNAAGINLMISGHLHKYVFSAPKEHDQNFPIVVNNKGEVLQCTVSEDNHISIVIKDSDGKVTHTHEF